ncbi:TPA: hypothetical protein QDB45_001716 [Burkholderia vietnamiensis]|nr:hypothetical protein [Burkholderia vietnamiensis]
MNDLAQSINALAYANPAFAIGFFLGTIGMSCVVAVALCIALRRFVFDPFERVLEWSIFTTLDALEYAVIVMVIRPAVRLVRWIADRW